jgi:hypothetical protein
MPRPRFSIAGLMGIVAMMGLGLAALRSPTETWAGGMLLLTCGVLALAVIGAIARRGTRRMWWLGFSLFGWGYLILSGCGSDEPSSMLPTAQLLMVLAPRLGVPPRLHGGNPFCGWGAVEGLDPHYAQIGHCLWALLAAALGGMLAGTFFAPPSDHTEATQPEVNETSHPLWGRCLPLTITGLVVLILVGAIATVRSETGASLWAGLTFALTCTFNGLIALGALVGRGRRRAVWLGAALFGMGYTALIFSRPGGQPPRTQLATDSILNGLRGRFAPIAKSIFPPNARILEALDRPVPTWFPNEAPLAEVLSYIKEATSTPTYSGIPIYVDPIGLQEAERSMNSTVQIDLEGVPLRTTLRLCLKPLGLCYEVDEGYLRITAEDSDRSRDLEDPFLVVGNCLLALIAAGIGAVAAPLVAGASRGEPAGQRSQGG